MLLDGWDENNEMLTELCEITRCRKRMCQDTHDREDLAMIRTQLDSRSMSTSITWEEERSCVVFERPIILLFHVSRKL